MYSIIRFVFTSFILMILPFAAANSQCNNCCVGMGGTQYCDSSAGRLVCHNGEYSSCYCTRHAVMDLQKIKGCCLWQGGVFKVDERGLVVCNDGGVSEMCTLATPEARVAM